MVKEAEIYLYKVRAYLDELKTKVQNCDDLDERDKLKTTLEQDQIRFSQLMSDVVIFKAAYGISIDPEELKKLK